MKRITIEESKDFIACNEDFTSNGIENAQFFTLTPSSKGDNWEDITYYTARSSAMYSNRDGEYDSWVYILSNPTMPGFLKIGYTKKNPDERAKQISNATGVALPYEVEFAYSCWNGLELEKDIHERLNEYRLSKQREFFQVDLDEVKEIIGEIGESYI